MPHRILLADDSLTIRKVIELTFSGTEFELKAVGNGDQAVPLLDSFLPDIVLADCVIPGKTGYELCEEVKRRPGGRFVPVILLTGTFEPFDRPRAELAGADSFVTKPFDSQGLASLVRDLLAKAAEERAVAPPEASPAPEVSSPSPAEGTEESPEASISGPEAFFAGSMGETQELLPPPERDAYTTMMIPFSRESEMAPPPPPEEVTLPPPPDPPTVPIAYPPPEPSPSPYETDLDTLDDELPHRDLEADIAAFEASGRSVTRPDLWDSPAAKAAAADSPPEHAPGDLEALAAEASRSDLKSLIPQASALAAPAAGRLSDDDIDRIARRVLELSGERIVRKIAWDVVPELAERLVNERLDELDKAE